MTSVTRAFYEMSVWHETDLCRSLTSTTHVNILFLSAVTDWK